MSTRAADFSLFSSSPRTSLILSCCCGVGREEAHEVIKTHAVAAALGIRKGQPNVMLDAIGNDARIPLSKEELVALISKPLEFTGDAHAQVERVVHRIEAITKAHPAAAQYRPGSIR